MAVGGVGLVAGFVGSMLGIGGGVFLVPLFSVVLGLPLKLAIATSLVCVIATAAAGANVYLRQGLADIRLAMLLEIPTVVGAIAGGMLASVLEADALALIFVALALYTAWTMFRRHGRSQGDARGGPGPEETELAATGDPGEGGVSAGGGSWREREYFDAKAGRVVRYRIERLGPGLAVSVVGGLASGLLGIGGGIIKVPVMNLAMKVPMRVAVATSNFMVGITAAASAVVYYVNGLVDPLVASAAALAVLVGGNLGARTAARVDQGMLARVFAVVLAVLALQMLYRVLGSAGG